MTTRKRRILLAGFASIFWVSVSQAAVLTVTSNLDTIAVDGFVTLREAIEAANTNASPNADIPVGGDPGLDTINFNIPGLPGTVHTIALSSALQSLTDTVFINGYSQPGSTENTAATGTNAFLTIVLDGSGAGAAVSGLIVSDGGSTIQGLVINNFSNAGILIDTDNNVVRGNFLGTDQTGKIDQGNAAGVSMRSVTNNIIGGTVLGDRNLISGNEIAGVTIIGATSSANLILNNLIGTDDTATAALANTGDGVRIADAADNSVGGTSANSGNVIAYNGDDGVALTATALAGNLIAGNSIHSNGSLGIDLADDGVTANDTDDPDAGANDLQNFPVLTEATSNALGTNIEGTLNSLPSTEFRVELFSNTVADLSGFGEGEVYLGFVDVTTNAAGDATFSFSSNVVLTEGTLVTATATAPNNSTSEFSEALEVEITRTFDDDDDDDGEDDEFIPVPVPVPVPPPPPYFEPLPAVAPVVGPVAPAPAILDKAPKPEFEITVDGLEENLTSPAPAKVTKAKASGDESGCSTVGGSFSLLWFVLLGLYVMRQRIHPKWRR